MAIALLASATAAMSATAPPGHAKDIVLKKLLTPPTITTQPGFHSTTVIPPGQLYDPGELYDPLSLVPRDGSILLNDDGEAIGQKGGRLLAITADGKISVVMDVGQLLPITGFDVAPKGFGKFAGQVFSLAQPTTGMEGALSNHVIQRIDLSTRVASVFCTLPPAGKAGKGIAGYGFEAHFGLPGSRFAGRLFSVTALNDIIYETLADGTCRPFVDTSEVGPAGGFTFTPDGSAMLVTVAPDIFPSQGSKPSGAIIRISPEGKIDPTPIVTGIVGPSGIAVAPAGFGTYGGEIFVSDTGDMEIPAPKSQPLKPDGAIFRVTKDGHLIPVASGFINPVCLRFIDSRLWVTDINGDFIAGGRELPDGFIVRIDAD